MNHDTFSQNLIRCFERYEQGNNNPNPVLRKFTNFAIRGGLEELDQLKHRYSELKHEKDFWENVAQECIRDAKDCISYYHSLSELERKHEEKFREYLEGKAPYSVKDDEKLAGLLKNARDERQVKILKGEIGYLKMLVDSAKKKCMLQRTHDLQVLFPCELKLTSHLLNLIHERKGRNANKNEAMRIIKYVKEMEMMGLPLAEFEQELLTTEYSNQELDDEEDEKLRMKCMGMRRSPLDILFPCELELNKNLLTFIKQSKGRDANKHEVNRIIRYIKEMEMRTMSIKELKKELLGIE